jgi:hypothetical protein
VRKIDQLKRQIRQLSCTEFAELRLRIFELGCSSWNSKVERDGRHGKLNSLLAEAKEEFESGEARKH